jgi:hypothetical protein
VEELLGASRETRRAERYPAQGLAYFVVELLCDPQPLPLLGGERSPCALQALALEYMSR